MDDMDSEDDFFDPELNALERLSNSMIAPIKQGRLEDAERACLELERRYPAQIDGLERMASVHEARGDLAAAIECYRRSLPFIESTRTASTRTARTSTSTRSNG